MLSSNSFIDFTSPNSAEIIQEEIKQLKSVMSRYSLVADSIEEVENEIIQLKHFINTELKSQKSMYKTIIKRQELKPKTEELEALFKKKAVLLKDLELAKKERIEARARLRQLINPVERFKEEQANQRGESENV